MAKIVRAWAPFFAIAGPALYALATGLVVLAARAGMGGSWIAGAARAMGVPAAVGLAACGVGLLAAYRFSRAARVLRYACAAALAVMGIAGGVQNALDLAGAGARMSPPTALALLLTAVLLVTFDRAGNRVHALLVQLLIGVLLAVGLVSIIAFDVRLDVLLPWYRFGRMPEAAAAGFIAVGVSLLGLVARTAWYETLYARHEDEKILVLVLGILTLVAVTMGAAAFFSMQRNLERALHGTLANAVDDRAAILDSMLANRVTRAAIVATRPAAPATLREPVRDAAARERLRIEAASFLGAGFTGVSFQDAAGQVVAEAGALTEIPALEVPLDGQRAPSSLLWSDAFLLRVRTPVTDGGRVVGTVVTEQSLDLLPRLQFDLPEIGRTAEWVLCGPRGAQMACLPGRFTPKPQVLDRRPQGVPLPMDYALAGGTGVIVAPDYRGERVAAGFAPLGRTGMGVVLKVRLDEIYGPLRHDLDLWWRWYFAVVLAAALLVASQVRPVAQRLVQSERMSRERAEVLARSERALRELYAALGEGIIVLTRAGRIEFVNPAAERLFGYGAQELVGRPVSMLIPEELREANAAATRRFVESGTSNVLGAGNQVLPALRRDGSRFDLEFSLAPMGQGEQLHLVAVLRDVSQRTALERMKREFTATVSHELRTPLTSVMGSLELLREDSSLAGPERELLEMAWRNSQRLVLLVNDVIDAERIESGALRFEATRFALRAFLEEAVRLDQPYASMHEAELRLEEPVPEVELVCDRDRLLQVMANLVSNAAKFSPPRGEVRVGAKLRDSRVCIEVSDRGRGIPEEFRARVFERFAQADASDERDKGGTGLGLAICKAIVERMGGTIGFNDRPGGGTTFWFELPAEASAR